MRILPLVLAALLVSGCGSSDITGTPTTGAPQSVPSSSPSSSAPASQSSSKSGEGEGNFPITTKELPGLGFEHMKDNVWKARSGDIEVVQTSDGYTSEVRATDGSLTCSKMMYYNWTKVNVAAAQILYYRIKNGVRKPGTHEYPLPDHAAHITCTSR